MAVPAIAATVDYFGNFLNFEIVMPIGEKDIQKVENS